jgi:ribose 5-phosphate isomerase RpiB
LISEPEALAILETWLTTPFEDGRHQRRIEMIDELSSPDASG